MTATVMGIHTKEFGENTHLSDALLAQPYYEYLNELAVEPEGVLLSSNCKMYWSAMSEILFLQ